MLVCSLRQIKYNISICSTHSYSLYSFESYIHSLWRCVVYRKKRFSYSMPVLRTLCQELIFYIEDIWNGKTNRNAFVATVDKLCFWKLLYLEKLNAFLCLCFCIKLRNHPLFSQCAAKTIKTRGSMCNNHPAGLVCFQRSNLK